MTKEKQEKLFYTLQDIKEQVYQNDVSIATLQNMVHTGKMPSVRVMSKIFVPRWWVEEQIAIAMGNNHGK